MPNVNQNLFDMIIRHAIGLERLKAGLINDIVPLLDEVNADMINRLRQIDPEQFRAQKLRKFITQLQESKKRAYTEIGKTLKEEMISIADYEAKFTIDGIKRITPLGPIMSAPSSGLIYAAAVSEIRGDLLSGWLSNASSSDIRGVTRAVRVGLAEGDSIAQMVRSVKTTNKKGRRAIEAVIRTSVNDVTSKAREVVFVANKKIIKRVKWVSTLDGRTTLICQLRDGKTFPVGEGPRPPAHISCRSMTMAITRNWDELSPAAKKELSKLSQPQRSALGGAVDSDINYGDWLRNQPLIVQEDALGKARAALFRQGDLPLNRFIDPTGKFYSLKALRNREATRGLFDDLG